MIANAENRPYGDNVNIIVVPSLLCELKMLRSIKSLKINECLYSMGVFLGQKKDDVIHITDFREERETPSTFLEIPLYKYVSDTTELIEELFPGDAQIVAYWDEKKDKYPVFYLMDQQQRASKIADFVEIKRMVYDPRVDQFSRIEGIFETKKLSGKIATIIGLGTGGSICAEQLARCSVDRFKLVDFDRLEPHNIARHTCDLSDLGRLKTQAVAERIRKINPSCQIKTFEVDITSSPDLVKSIITGSDIVLVCTDNNPSRYMINEYCLKENVPAIYAGAFERAFGGQIFRVIPHKTPCYDCVIGSLQETLGDPQHHNKGPIPYSELEDPSEFKAEPGLFVDVCFIALIQTKMALLTLLYGAEIAPEDLPNDFILWGNKKEWIFPDPFFCQFANVEFRENCSTCIKTNLSDHELNKMRHKGEQILKSTTYDPDIFRKKT